MTFRTRAVPVALVLSLAVPACGGDDGGGEDDAQRAIAAVVERLQELSREGDAKAICEDVFVKDLAESVGTQNQSTCEKEVRRQLVRDDAEFRTQDIVLDGENAATATVVQSLGRPVKVSFGKRDGDWRITSLNPDA